MRQILSILALAAAAPAAAETRQLDAHVHGTGALNIAIEGSAVAMELEAPGADIVGFEHAAESEADRAAIDAAVAALARPLDLFVFPAEAGCSVTAASAGLEGGESHHEGSGHEEHAHEEHHEDHAGHDHEYGHEGHDAAEHAEDHEGHDDHDGRAGEEGHTEFHAAYTLACADPAALTGMTFAYFAAFGNARELEVQVITASGAQAFEVTREQPVLDLRSLF